MHHFLFLGICVLLSYGSQDRETNHLTNPGVMQALPRELEIVGLVVCAACSGFS